MGRFDTDKIVKEISILLIGKILVQIWMLHYIILIILKLIN